MNLLLASIRRCVSRVPFKIESGLMEQVRINVRRLSVYVLVSLVLPLAGALLLDLGLGSLPWLTIGATVIFIPLSSVLVIRATLAELDSVIQAVAPLDAENKD